jgi:hypothetical protein
MSIKYLIPAVLCGILLTTAGCERREGAGEKAGEKIDETIDKAGEKAEDAGKEAEKAGEGIKDSVQ